MNILAWLAPYAPCVVVPLGLSLSNVSRRHLIWSIAAGAGAAASFALEPGGLAILMLLPYVAFAIWISWRMRGQHPSLLYLAPGSLLLVPSRIGISLPGFPDAAVLLTALHFHYAGFAACVFAARTGQALGQGARSPWYRYAASGIVFGALVMIIGISVSPWMEAAGGLALAIGVTVMSGLAVASARGRIASLCFTATAAATVLSMALAGIYAASQVSGAYWLPIPQMAVAHAVSGAMGLPTIGLIGHLWDKAA